MIKRLLILFLIINFQQVAFSQKNSKKIQYIIDRVPFDPSRDSGLGLVLNEDIFEQKIITNKDSLTAMGYPSYDTVTYVITKSYKDRSIADLNVPTRRLMIQKNESWLLEGGKKKYSGKFIDYFLNGKKGTEGELLNGKLNGVFKEYYNTGIIRSETNYVNGIKDGIINEYFINGHLKISGQYFRGQKYQEWKYFYSTGSVNYVERFDIANVNEMGYSPPITSVEQDSVSSKIRQAAMHMAYERYSEAIKLLDVAANSSNRLNETYYYRGLAKLGNKDDLSALADFEKAIEIEPLYALALQCKALTIIKKYDWNLFFRHGAFVYTGDDTFKIPENELKQICDSFKLAASIQIVTYITKQSIEKYCLKVN